MMNLVLPGALATAIVPPWRTMGNVGEHLAAQSVRRAQRLVTGGKVPGHPVERARHARDFVPAPIWRSDAQVARTQPFGRILERRETAPRWSEDDDDGNKRRDHQHDRARQR
jgi:hypothetical protein